VEAEVYDDGLGRAARRGTTAGENLSYPPDMGKRIEPCRKSPEERLDDLLGGYREASLRNEGEKYVQRAIEASDSLPNAVKLFAWALLAADAADEEAALDALAKAESYLEVARGELGRRFAKELPSLRFLERGIALRSDRGEFEEALRLCDVALSLGLGSEYERKKATLLRMV
jgi:hypothetical protein